MTSPQGTTSPQADTTDLRRGAPLHDALLALLPLVGGWTGSGRGVVASTGVEFGYQQRIRFAHDGRPFLVYEARSWLVDDAGAMVRPAWRESGFWRPGPGPDGVEVVLASNTGQLLGYAGSAADLQWEITTVSVGRAPTAEEVDGERRMYAIQRAGGESDRLLYATELAPAGAPYAPHLNATLTRDGVGSA